MKQSSNIRDSVMEKIAEHKVAMRSKTYFKVEFFLIALVALAVVLITIALTGFIFYALRINGHESLLLFGPRAILALLLIFPWTLFLIDVLLVLMLTTLMRKFAFGYRRPVLILMTVIIALGGVAGVLLDRETSFHDELRDQGKRGMLPPPLDALYGHARGPAPHGEGIFRGIVTSVNGSDIYLLNDEVDMDDATTTHEVLLPAGLPQDFISVGDTLYVFGYEENGIVHALGFRKLDSVK